MSCSANFDHPMKIEICIQAANIVLTQFYIATISVKSFGAMCSFTYVQAVSLEHSFYISRALASYAVLPLLCVCIFFSLLFDAISSIIIINNEMPINNYSVLSS